MPNQPSKPNQPGQPREPDLHFDIDALFDHMVNNLEHRLENEKEWSFTFRDEDLEKLSRIGEALSDEFDVHLQEEVETYDGDRVFMGPPLLAVIIVASLLPDEVKTLAARFAALAADESLVYEGVGVCDPIDMDELMEWLDLDAARSRLRAFTDSGLAPGEDLPFVFLVEPEHRAGAKALAAAFAAAGFDDTEIAEEGDATAVFVQFPGRNDEALLKSVYARVERVALAKKADLVGVQFFDDDDDGVYDDDDEDDLDSEDGGEDEKE
ncbi:MAG: hypothetical protein IT431_11090 [Phycisphaerales bacterium]|nr:hypothetical protein [Phycisphaerales bacterium]